MHEATQRAAASLARKLGDLELDEAEATLLRTVFAVADEAAAEQAEVAGFGQRLHMPDYPNEGALMRIADFSLGRVAAPEITNPAARFRC